MISNNTKNHQNKVTLGSSGTNENGIGLPRGGGGMANLMEIREADKKPPRTGVNGALDSLKASAQSNEAYYHSKLKHNNSRPLEESIPLGLRAMEVALQVAGPATAAKVKAMGSGLEKMAQHGVTLDLPAQTRFDVWANSVKA